VEIIGCEMLREATHGCRLVLLAATAAEAEPLRGAFVEAERHLLATKTLYVGAVSGGPRAVLALSGCDKANVTHVLTGLLQAMVPPPALVLQVGIAGALPNLRGAPAPDVGDIVLATQEVYSDTGSSSPDGWIAAGALGLPIAQVDGAELGGAFPLDRGLVQAAVEVIGGLDWPESPGWAGGDPAVFPGPCITASMATGLRSEAVLAAQRWGALAESMEGAAAAHMCALYKVPFLEVRGISNLVDDRDRGAWQVDRAIEVAGRAALAVARALDGLPIAGSQACGRGPGHGGE
jgi:futalosine hydrolase